MQKHIIGSFIRKPGKDGMPIEEFNGGCSYSFVNWEMLFVRPNRGMLTPSH